MFLFLLTLLPFVQHGEGFTVDTPFLSQRASKVARFDTKGDVLDEVGNKAKELAKQATAKINELTGKDEYEFGDLTRLLDQKARAAVSDLTEKEEADFGDLIEIIDRKIKDVILENKDELDRLKEISSVARREIQGKFTELVGESETPGDLKEMQEVATREIMSLIKSRDYSIGDLFFLLKLCTSFGLGMNPAVMSIFPLNVLIQLYNFSLIQEAGNSVAASVALELDRRARKVVTAELEKEAKTALFGDADADVGALFLKSVRESIGKSAYEFGDISRNLLRVLDEGEDTSAIQPIGVADKAESVEVLDAELVEELEALDRALEEVAE